MVPSLSRNILAKSLRPSSPETEEWRFASRAVRVWHGSQDPWSAGCLQAVMAGGDCLFVDGVCPRERPAYDSSGKESYCFAPQVVEKELPRGKRTSRRGD